jgi:2-keto-3-deoxy-L-rhamnonate aldolase RhmA/mannose-6-phosphate isomerase-like protein (cupin superfamily)
MGAEPVLRILDGAGYDFIGLDCQHGALSEADAAILVGRMARARTALLVRVSANLPSLIGKVLDAGADGVIVPLVDTAEEAEMAVAACRFPPAGARSFGPIREDLPRSPSGLEERASCFAMIETPRGVGNAEEICAVQGLDGILVGPADLSIGLGGDPIEGFTTDRLVEPVERIRAACEQAGITLGVFVGEPESAPAWIARGARMLVVSTDRGLLGGAATSAREAASGSSRLKLPGREIIAELPKEDLVFGDIEVSRAAIRTDESILVFHWISPHREDVSFDAKEVDQTVMVLDGEMVFKVGEIEYPLKGGEVMQIPAGTPYRGRVVGERTAFTLDIFAPIRAEYIHLVDHQRHRFG